ncbi:EKC/KEOPS complex subunit LAGE3-like [Peromyscus californicus insignis]|uniref:EKC/KEOPS complex subunit LAGE3-like n=1 Tax=Peromyscus californicus insignis TaxID=564181 RepID=UPI0022A8002B|nr:EKC/KEOPS complex subunit LAGE3-like [Peromyscus californicus insignis]
MQDPSGNNGCRTDGEEEDGQHTSRTPHAQASSQSSEAENDHGNTPHESQPQDSGSQAAQGSLDSRSPVEARVVAEEAAIAPQSEQAPIIPGPSGDAATTAGSRLLEFSVTVPFRTAVEANIACRSLASNVQHQQVMVQQEFTVNDTTLTVRWTTEDPVLFRTSINAFLDQLSLVMRSVPRPVFMAVFKQGRGRNNEL